MTNRSRAKKQVNIAEAKAHFSDLVQRASMGEEVIIAKDNRPLAKLVPIREAKEKRKPGSAKIWMADDFDATPEVFKDCSRYRARTYRRRRTPAGAPQRSVRPALGRSGRR